MLINSGNQIRKDIALTLQSELADIGIECQVRELDWSIFLQRVKSKDFAAMVLGWSSGVKYAPDMYQIWHSSQAADQGSNAISFIHAEADSLLEAYRREFDAEKRIALYKRFQEILYDEQPYTFLWKSRVAQAYSRRFAGVNWYLQVRTSPSGGLIRKTAYISKGGIVDEGHVVDGPLCWGFIHCGKKASKSLSLIVIVATVSWSTAYSFGNFGYGLLSLCVLVLSLAHYFSPLATGWMRPVFLAISWDVRHDAWTEFRRVDARSNGLFLSPFARP